MKIRNRNLLTLALASVLAAPLAAAAQSETTQSELDAQEQATEALPPQANPIAEQQVDPRVPVDEEDPMDAVPPPVQTMGDASMGAEQSADHSDVAQRARWTELDVNGDGRIDAQEAAVDMDFNANFEMMDADGDGFVTDAEYRTHAMGNPPRNDGSMDHDSMDHDSMDDMDDATDDAMDDDIDDGTDDTLDDGIDDGIDDPVDG